MKKIVILKTGQTLNNILKLQGDFNQMIINQGAFNFKDVITIDCKKQEKLPNIKDIKGIIITGSHSMVTDYEPWSVRISSWIEKIIDNNNIPVLGICYGHQLLADILGAKIGYNLNGIELGTKEINLTEEGKNDKLLGILPEKFKGYEAHSQSVLSVSEKIKILAYNDNCIQAFRYGKYIWGTQFHPEFTSDTVKGYVDFEKNSKNLSDKDYECIINNIEELEYGTALLKRFVNIVEEVNFSKGDFLWEN